MAIGISHKSSPPTGYRLRAHWRASGTAHLVPMGSPTRAGSLRDMEGVITSEQTSDDMRKHAFPPHTFKHSLQAFAIKKEYIQHGHGVVAYADQLRALFKKNIDNEIAIATGASVCMPVWMSSVGKIQRGFVRGRQLIHNVIVLDSMAHLHSLAPSQQICLLALCDFPRLSLVSSTAGFSRL